MKLISLARTPLEFKLEVLDLLRSYQQALHQGSSESRILTKVITQIAGVEFRDPSKEPGLGPQLRVIDND